MLYRLRQVSFKQLADSSRRSLKLKPNLFKFNNTVGDHVRHIFGSLQRQYDLLTTPVLAQFGNFTQTTDKWISLGNALNKR